MDTIGTAFIERFAHTKIGVLIDDTTTTPRGILVAPAHDITPAEVNRLITLSGGLLFAALSAQRVDALLLTPMTRPHSGGRERESIDKGFAICTSVEAREGVTTGISASDRAETLKILGDPLPNPRKLVQPGHIFPVATRDGGVLVKTALPEGALDIVRIAGFTDAAVFLEIVGGDGELPSWEDLSCLCQQEGIPSITLAELVRYRLETEPLVSRVAEAKLPTRLGGEFRAYLYRSSIHGGEHVALVKGTIDPETPILTRVQPEFTFSDVFGGKNPPTKRQLQRALEIIGERDSGIFLYLRRPLPGQLTEQVESWELKYREKPAAMMREYGIGAQVLRDLGVRKIELLTSSRRKLLGLHTFGIDIVSQIPLFEEGEE